MPRCRRGYNFTLNGVSGTSERLCPQNRHYSSWCTNSFRNPYRRSTALLMRPTVGLSTPQKYRCFRGGLELIGSKPRRLGHGECLSKDRLDPSYAGKGKNHVEYRLRTAIRRGPGLYPRQSPLRCPRLWKVCPTRSMFCAASTLATEYSRVFCTPFMFRKALLLLIKRSFTFCRASFKVPSL